MLIILFGAVVGALQGLVGAGGSILAVPALVYGLGMPMSQAVPAALVIVGVSSIAGIVPRARDGVDWPLAALLGITGAAASFAGSAVNRMLDDRALMLVFAAIMVVAGIRMLRPLRPAAAPGAGSVQAADTDSVSSSDPDSASGPGPDSVSSSGSVPGDRPISSRRRWGPLLVKGTAAGCAVGFLTGLLGVGGGFLLIPVLLLVLRVPMAVAIGTSLVVIVINCAGGLLSYLGHAELDWGVTALFTLAATIASVLGTRVARSLPDAVLTRGFAVLVLVLAAGVGAQAILT